MPIDEVVDAAGWPVGQRVAQCGLSLFDALGARNLGVATGNERFGFVVERAQKLAFPAVPDARPDGHDVCAGQQQKKLQPLGALHDVSERADRIGIGNITRMREVAHRQMLLNEPGDELGLGCCHAEARANLARDARTDGRVAFLSAFADVVDERRDEQRPAILD